MKYVYFVSYILQGIGGMGYGHAEIKRDKPITHIEQISEIEYMIVDKSPGVHHVTILNYQLLREEENVERN